MVSFVLHTIIFSHVEQTKILVVNFRTGVFHDIMPFFIINHLSLVNLFLLKSYTILNPNIWQPRAQGAFPWLWRWVWSKARKKPPGDEVEYLGD